MDTAESEIKFYSLGSKRLDLSKIGLKSEEIDLSKPIRTSKKFNEALNAVTRKDINVLNKKAKSIQSEITKRLAVAGTILKEKLDFEIKDIESLISRVDEITSNLIITKGNGRVGLFSSNKKLKKDNLKKMDECIEYLSKCQKELISMKNEYNKLMSRSTLIEDVLINDSNSLSADEEDTIEEDPMERTINFYMNNIN